MLGRIAAIALLPTHTDIPACLLHRLRGCAIMLHYLNRLGERIDAAHWRQLLRLRSYCELLVSRRRGERLA